MKHLGAGEACRAHNPEVRRSKLRGATFSFFSFITNSIWKPITIWTLRFDLTGTEEKHHFPFCWHDLMSVKHMIWLKSKGEISVHTIQMVVTSFYTLHSSLLHCIAILISMTTQVPSSILDSSHHHLFSTSQRIYFHFKPTWSIIGIWVLTMWYDRSIIPAN